MTIINMQTMRYINLLDRVSRVKTTRCFVYNNTIIFAVPQEMMSQAIGPSGRNVRAIQEQLGKRVKIICSPSGLEDLQNFVQAIVEPIGFRSVDVQGNEIVLNAGSRNKASLIGRDKARWNELSQVLEDIFGMALRIV